VLLSISPIRDPNGDVIGASAISHDITQRKRAERLLRADQAVTSILTESKNLEEAGPRVLQSVAECLRWEVAVLWSVDREANVLRRVYCWHSSWAKRPFIEALSQATVLEPGMGIAGRTWSTGEPVWEPGISINDPGKNATITRDGLRGGFGFPMRHGAQMVGVIEFYNPEIREPDDTLLVALDNIACQISQFCEKRRTETALRASEEQLRNLVMALPAAVYTTDQTGLITLFNDNAAELWGWRPEIGKHRWDGAWKLFRQDGTPVPLDQSPLAVTLSKGSDLFGEELILERPNGSRAHVLKHPKLLRGAAGEIVGAVNMVIDLTQMKQLETQFWQAQKMEAVGRLAGGVAHDFNNLLTVICGYGQMLKEKVQPEDSSRPMIEQIVLAGEKATLLTRQLLTFSRHHVHEVQQLDLNVIIRESKTMLSRLIGEDIRIETQLAPTVRPLQADPGHMNQILMNLAVNARDAMPDGGRLLIETRNVDLDKHDAKRPGSTQQGAFVLLSVTDTGCGMDEATRLRIFEPFFTTKAPDKGTGLGLSTIYGIVHMCGGHIEVDSEVGRGTTFRIYLPEGQPTLQPKPLPAKKVKCAGGAETVLLVEDDVAVRRLATQLLASRGYRVLEARGGPEGLALAQGCKEPIHLLLTDVIMPEMNGRVLADRLKCMHPETVIVFMSGYTGEAIAHHRVNEPGTYFLQKPFTPDSLAAKVRDVLDATPANVPQEATA
jgi:two-component system cell cycle sensor histidine kinase/response regulator CckA